MKVFGAPTINPKTRERRYNQFVNAPTYVTKPLFPRYIFAQFKINDLYHNVRFTRGVYSVVGFGEGPTPIDEEIIMLIETVSYQAHIEIERDMVKKAD